MIIELKVPQLSASVAEATLGEWHVQVGDMVSRDQNLVDIETDKVVLELPAPDAGMIVEIIKEGGSIVVSGELIAKLDTEIQAPATVSAAKKILSKKNIATEASGSEHDGRITKDDAINVVATPSSAISSAGFYEYAKKYFELIRNYKEEIIFANSLQEDLRKERAKFFSETMKEVSNTLKSSQVESHVASMWLKELVSSYTKSLDLSSGLIDKHILDTIGRIKNIDQIDKKISENES